MRHALIVSPLFILFWFAACERKAPENEVGGAAPPGRAGIESSPSVASGAAQQSDTPFTQALACSPTTFGPGDTVTVRMKTPHAGYLGINDPDGIPFFVIYPGGSLRKDSAMPSETFENVSTFRLPADIKARPWVANRDVPEPVFTRPGTYRLLVGYLETDGTPPDECALRYRGDTK